MQKLVSSPAVNSARGAEMPTKAKASSVEVKVSFRDLP